jgi:lipopolysaccharide transport system permease protein
MTTTDSPAPLASVHAEPVPLRVLRPTKGWRIVDVRELWAFRELLYVLTARDIRVRYKQTVLGATWAILQPFTSMVVMSVVFGHLAGMPSDGVPYPVFVYAGMLPWTFFSASVSRSSTSMLGSAHLISKVYFPRLIIPIAAIGGPLVDFAVALSILFGLMAFYGVALTLNLLFAPLIVVGMIFVATGTGALLSGITVRYRDFNYVIPFGIQLWMWASPVVYPPSLFPVEWRPLLFLNPMAGFIDGFRSAFLGKPLDVSALGISLAAALALFVAGALVFARTEKTLADVL